MGSVVSSALGWVFGTIFYFTLSRVEDVVTWILPIYMTVQVLKRKESLKYNNYLSFWCIASLLFGIDWITAFFLHSILLFRIARIVFLIWIFLDSCHNSVYLVNAFLTPVIDEHRESIEEILDKLDDTVSMLSNQIKNEASNRVGSMVESSQAQITSSLLNFGSMASKSLNSFISNAEEHDNNNSDNNNSNNNKKKDDKSDSNNNNNNNNNENKDSNDNSESTTVTSSSGNSNSNSNNDNSSDLTSSTISNPTENDNKEVET